jgi:hypothetical protein
MACKYVLTRSDSHVTILSDSQAAILGISKSLIRSLTVYEAVKTLCKLRHTGLTVGICWVKGHNDCNGNDFADHMAGLASLIEIEGPELFLPLASVIVKTAAQNNNLLNNGRYPNPVVRSGFSPQTQPY